MGRRQYFDDPSAPIPTTIVPAASAAVRNHAGDLLLEWRRDNNLWTLPGGTMHIGERLIDTAVREVNEETGIAIQITGLVGIYTDPRHIIAYDNGEVRQQFNICFAAQPTGGTLRASSESHAVRWVPIDQLPDLPIHAAIRLRIDHALSNHPQPYLG
jgi:ADP-ribose pyrophosphatase YjhB (NUDIX family)